MRAQTATISPTVLGLRQQKSQLEMVESVIANAMRNGRANLTAFEAMNEVQRVYGVQMWPGTVSRVVSQLVAAGRVLQDKQNRRLSQGPGASDIPSAVLTVPMRQADCY